MSTIDKRALREAAEKATPGPWGIARNGKTITSNQSHPVAVITEDFHRLLANGKTGGDAEFIAEANPATVLSLLDELEAKDQRIAELESREVVLPQRYSMLHRVDFDEPYHTEMVYKQHQVLKALHNAGINVAAAGKGE
ncbi:ead/Ea22-like family protein [Enterobacter roggenkampii]|nr:ead/Ea22-like family protein [Enterobacter roggenkampii]